MKEKIEAAIQIILLVGAMFAFSYFINQVFDVPGLEAVSAQTGDEQQSSIVPEDLFSQIAIGLAQFQGFGGLPSGAIDPQQIIQQIIASSNGGVSVCTETMDHKLCQTYSTKDCEEVCAGKCVEISSFNSADANDWPEECLLGTCLDEETGSCEPRSPQETCNTDGGEWLAPGSNDARCRKGCCILGDQGRFVTEQQCAVQATSLGLEYGGDQASFDGAITQELECLAVAETNADDRGACTFSSGGEKDDCSITSYESCRSQGGEFNVGKLCSHPDLNTRCEATVKTDCDDELNAVYWYDSCGNRENIFDSTKSDDGWNDGEILDKADSCGVASGGNPTAKQSSCGNCFYAAGTKCSAEVSGQELKDDPDGGVVCKDLSCDDPVEGERANGESWCAYQGQFGNTDLNIPLLGASNKILGDQFGPLTGLLGGQRSRDTPGSRHFRLNCFEGEIVEVPCQDYRSEICEESQNSAGFSQAVCRTNRWQECLNYNPTKSGDGIGKLEIASAIFQCESDPDCFVRNVNVDDDFSFPVCVPKYAPGFDLQNSEDSKQICSYASQTCNVVYVKEIGGWTCKANCDCETPKFAEEMNDVCMSLGDCGMSVNYQGDWGTGGYVVKKKGSFLPEWGMEPGILYRAQIAGYGSATEGKYIQSTPNETLRSIGASSKGLLGIVGSLFGIDGGGAAGGGGPGSEIIGAGRTPGVDNAASGGVMLAGVTGAIGGATAAASTYFGVGALQSLAATTAVGPGGTIVSGGAATAAPAATAFGGALAGAGVGMAVTSLLLEWTGVGRGLSPAMAYGLMGAGAVAGAVAGVQLMTAGGAACVSPPGVGCIMLVVIIVIIGLMKLFGIGDVEVREYTFQCNPWQPPAGGANCELCGSDDATGLHDNLGCSRYACESLGQSCKFIEEEPNSYCINNAPNDVDGPRISEWEEAVTEGFEYQNVEDNGFDVRRKSGEQCITQFESVKVGVEISELGRCKISGGSQTEFDQMDPMNSGLLGKEHDYTVSYNSLQDLVEGGFPPEERTEVNLYVECQDTNGNPSPGDYVINFCVNPIDLTAPYIIVTYPEVTFLPFDATEQEVRVYVNEPAEVRWSLGDESFDMMQNDFVCNEDNSCSVTVPLASETTRLCIKAMDHPEWIGTDRAGERNENVECKMLDLKKTSTDLEIQSVKPTDGQIIEVGLEINTLELEAVTSGGYEGTATCSYSIDSQPFAMFKAPIGNKHTQTFNQILAGEHTIMLVCSDSAGNSDEAQTSFTIKKDVVSPETTRVYRNSGELVILTNEDATCSFVNAKPQGNVGVCGFKVSDGNMMSGSGTSHTTSFDASKVYYVRCQDKFGNLPNTCSLIVRGGEF